MAAPIRPIASTCRRRACPCCRTHFARWVVASGALAADPAARHGDDLFPRRQEFGRYAEETLQAYLDDGRIQRVQNRVVGVHRHDDAWRVTSERSGELRADFLVIATTHPEPTLSAELRSWRDDRRLVPDGLADGALETIDRGDRVLIVGSGLTAADIVASLDARGHAGGIVMISRRGLRARAHPAERFSVDDDFTTPPTHTATALLERVRAAVRRSEAAGRNWQTVIDAVRAQAPAVWRALDPAARRRVVRHLRPFWDVHRFRIAPQVEAVLQRKFADASLELIRARLGAVQPSGDGVRVELLDRRTGRTLLREFETIIVATGPGHKEIVRAQPYLRELADLGFVSLDTVGLGLATSTDARALDATGAAVPSLFIAGPLARGTVGELMGTPEVPAHALFVAGQIRAALGRR